MARLMGLDYIIQYRKGKENKVADALSRCMEEALTASMITVVPDWYQEVSDSYSQDDWAKGMEQLIVNPTSKPGFTLKNGVLRYQG